MQLDSKLGNGHIVNLEIPKESQQGVSQRRSHKAILMPARVEDNYPFSDLELLGY